MNDLISREPMLEFLNNIEQNENIKVSIFSKEWVISFIESQPAIEAKEVVHGHWIIDEDGAIYCSCCGCEVKRNGESVILPDLFKFCPVCGVNMDIVKRKGNS